MSKKNWWMLDPSIAPTYETTAGKLTVTSVDPPAPVPLTDEAAEALMKQLSEHFHEPVMPIKRYCSALSEWFRFRELKAAERVGLEQGLGHVDTAALALEETRLYRRVVVDIQKSNFLWRRLYCGEATRTRPCPIHKGKWSGINACPEGCGSIGWLPNDLPPKERRVTRETLPSGKAWNATCRYCYTGITTMIESAVDAFEKEHMHLEMTPEELRKLADERWEAGDKKGATELHAKAADLSEKRSKEST